MDTGLTRPGKVHENVEVSGFQVSGEAVAGLRTSQGELPCLIRAPWVGGRPPVQDTLPVIDQLPRYTNAFVNAGR